MRLKPQVEEGSARMNAFIANGMGLKQLLAYEVQEDAEVHCLRMGSPEVDLNPLIHQKSMRRKKSMAQKQAAQAWAANHYQTRKLMRMHTLMALEWTAQWPLWRAVIPTKTSMTQYTTRHRTGLPKWHCGGQSI